MITIGHGAGFGIIRRNDLKKVLLSAGEKSNILGDQAFVSFQKEVLAVEEDLSTVLGFIVNNLKTNTIPIKRPTLSDYLSGNKSNLIRDEFMSIINDHIETQPLINYLTSFQFADIIETEFQMARKTYGYTYPEGIPIDMMLQVNCYMQTFENGYALRKVVKYLCGTNIGFPKYGIEYKQVFSGIATDPLVKIPSLFEIIKGAFIYRQSRELQRPYGDHDGITISLNSLTSYNDIFNQLNNLSLLFQQDFDALLGEKKLCCYVYDTRERGRFAETEVMSISDTFTFLDLRNFLIDFQKNINSVNSPRLKTAIGNLINASGETNIGTPHSTFDIESPLYPQSFGIFFPRRTRNLSSKDETTYDNLLAYYFKGEFSGCQYWDNFLEKYLNKKIKLHNIC
ncbi:hypothetical protein [Chitinophaga rhizophila]|uniref:Uncharacterized protein n=1 Tax=Chitinophaga rhizophila TaxID=2866212 RepID=A0ABS7G8U5_9BACT|nr:hypothetical protein [Chitinophaga rhizophila]MBW8683871.1 hypothetical protein [Chitinophaga rhizophila]